jgi:hypothetical protein
MTAHCLRVPVAISKCDVRIVVLLGTSKQANSSRTFKQVNKRVPAEFIVLWCRSNKLRWSDSETLPYGTHQTPTDHMGLTSYFSQYTGYVGNWLQSFQRLFCTCFWDSLTKLFHLETDMFPWLFSCTELNRTAKDVFCDAVHGIYHGVACLQNATGYHGIRSNVPWFTPIIKVLLTLRLGLHTYWRATWAEHLKEISTKSDKHIEIHLRLPKARLSLCCF